MSRQWGHSEAPTVLTAAQWAVSELVEELRLFCKTETIRGTSFLVQWLRLCHSAQSTRL